MACLDGRSCVGGAGFGLATGGSFDEDPAWMRRRVLEDRNYPALVGWDSRLCRRLIGKGSLSRFTKARPLAECVTTIG